MQSKMFEGGRNRALLGLLRAARQPERLKFLAVLEGNVELVEDLASVSVVDQLLRARERLINRRHCFLLGWLRRELAVLGLAFLQKS